MATLSTLSGWAVIIVFIGGYWYFYTNRPNRNRRVPALKPTLKPIDNRKDKEVKAKKPRRDSFLSNNDLPEKKRPQQPPKATREDQSHASSRATGVADQGNRDEVDNQEFARQLLNVKAGTVITNKSQAAPKQKSVKQSKAQEKLPVETSSDNATAPSSATGGDADDDRSPLSSPGLGATIIPSSVANGGVSDMLEQPAAGPSILKITEPTNPSRPIKAKPQQSFEAVETKKQRQNRKKAEAKKQAREEDEKERKILMEKQRRTAREAEGRAANDGSSFMASKPAHSAWTPSTTTASGSKPGKSNVELLDTYDPPKTKKTEAATIPAEALYSESELAGSDWQNHFSALPSEEEQTRIAIEESDNWETVKAKEKRKRENKPKAREDRQSSADERNDYGVPPVIAPTGPGKKWEATLVHVAPNGDVVEQEKELQDSEWEVA